jgi:hypothetical protein
MLRTVQYDYDQQDVRADRSARSGRRAYARRKSWQIVMI